MDETFPEKDYIDDDVAFDFLIRNNNHFELFDETLFSIKKFNNFVRLLYFLGNLEKNPDIDQVLEDLQYTYDCQIIKSVGNSSFSIKKVFLECVNIDTENDCNTTEFIVITRFLQNNCSIVLIEITMFDQFISFSYKL